MGFAKVLQLASSPIQQLLTMIESHTKRRKLDADAKDAPTADVERDNDASPLPLFQTTRRPDSPTTPPTPTPAYRSAFDEPSCGRTQLTILSSLDDNMATTRPRADTMQENLPEPKRVAIRRTTPVQQQTPLPQTEVFESDASLTPHRDCIQVHMRKHRKGKGRRGELQHRWCGDFEACDVARMPAHCYIDREYRLRSTNPPNAVEDLKRYLILPNSSLEGKSADAGEALKKLLNTGGFSMTDACEAISFAVDQVWDLHRTIKSLKGYGAREPYYLFASQPASKANSLASFLGPEQLEELDAEDLERELIRMADEIHYLGKCVERMTEKIVQAKWHRALDGYVDEINQLMALEIVSWDQVAEYCGIPGLA